MKCLNLIALLITTGLASAQPCSSQRYLQPVFSSVTVTQDIYYATADPYGPASSQDLYLDFYEPVGDSVAQRPLIIFAFGGGFLGGDKRQPNIPEVCENYAKLGYTVAAIDYRTGFNVIDPGSAERAVYRGVQDLRAAMRFFFEHWDVYGIDTTGVILTGTSAGCFSAFHSTFMQDADRPASTFGTFLEPDDMGCADCSGNNDYGNKPVPVRAIVNNWGAILDTSLIEVSEAVPVISFHGTNDLGVPYNSGNPFFYPIFPVVDGSHPIHIRLDKLEVENKLVPLVGAGHEPQLLEARWRDTIYQNAVPFLYKALAPVAPTIVGAESICSNDLGILHSYTAVGGPNSSFCWDIEGGLIVFSGNDEVQVAWDSTGGRLMLSEITHIGMQGGKDTLGVSVLPSPTAYAGEDTLVCYGESIQLDATASGTHSWGPITGLIGAHTLNPTAVLEDSITYTLNVIATNGCTASDAVSIALIPLPEAYFTYTNSASSIYCFDASTDATSYFWDFGDGATTTLINPSHTYTAAGTYQIMLKVENSFGCVDTISKQHSVLINEMKGVISPNYSFDVFPNPASRFLNVHIPAAGQEVKLSLINQLGQLLLERFFGVSSSDIDETLQLSGYPAGLYQLQLNVGGQLSTRKIVIQ